MCLAQGHNTVTPVRLEPVASRSQGHNTVTPVRLEPVASRSRVKHSTTEPLRSLREKG